MEMEGERQVEGAEHRREQQTHTYKDRQLDIHKQVNFLYIGAVDCEVGDQELLVKHETVPFHH